MQIWTGQAVIKLLLVIIIISFLSCVPEDIFGIRIDNEKYVYIGQPLSDAKQIMGEPLNELIMIKADISQNDIMLSEYDGLFLAYIRSEKKIWQIAVTDKYIFQNISIGDKLSEVKTKLNRFHLLGENRTAENYRLWYRYTEDAIYIISFTVLLNKDGTVIKIILNSSWPS